MGTLFQNVMSSLCIICVMFLTYTVGNNDFHDVSSREKAKTHIETAGRRTDGSACPCPPCMSGEECSENLTVIHPRFSSRFTFVEVNAEHHRHGVPLPYNQTTYPTDDKCPCHAFEYNISAVENVMEPDDPSRFHLFKINRSTGRIRLAENRAADITYSDLYRLTVTVRNVITNASDQTTISVAREKSEDEDLYSFKNGYGYSNGYESEHVIHERAVSVIPTEVNFTLTQLNAASVIQVGTRVTFQLDIVFPTGPTDISVELFTPDNETTVMILCDVKVESVGSNLATTLNGDPTFLAKDGWDVNIAPDMAVMPFGDVTNSGVDTDNLDASTIRILYAAVMIENSLTQNSGEYWVSAGAEYQLESQIYVAQASFTADTSGDQTGTLSDVECNVTMPTNIALGSSHIVSVEMYIPHPQRSYTFKVFTPADTVGVMSICAIWFDEFGQNFGCGNDASKIISATEADPQASGNCLATLELGTLLNKASRDEPASSIIISDNKVALSFVMHMYPDVTKEGEVLSVGLSLEIGTDTMVIGSSNFTVDPEVTIGLTDPVFVGVSSSLNTNLDDATVGQPFTLTYELQIPLPDTSDVASHYILEILAPFDGTPIFSVCSFEVIFVGLDMPCVKIDDLVTEYSSRVADGSGIEPDRASIDLGHVIRLNTSLNPTDDKIQIKATLMPQASHSSAVVGSTHDVSLGVQVGLISVTLTDTSIHIANPATITTPTDNTAPSFTMVFYDADDNVPVTGSTKVIAEMTTSRNITYDEMDMEFLMPTGPDYSYFHLCRVDIVFNGKNMPCMTPEWYSKLMQYTSKFDNYEMDRAELIISSMCNFEFEDAVAEDKVLFAFYVHVLNRPDLLHMTSKWLSMGLQFSSADILVGQLKLYATTGNTVTPTKSVYTSVTRNTTTTPTPIGFTVSYSLMVKIGRGDTVHLQVKATAQAEGAHICTVRVMAAGSNLPCAVDEVAARTYTNWPSGSGRKEVTADLGFVTNYGDTSENMTANNYFDSDTLIIEVLVRANPVSSADTYPVDIVAYYDTDLIESSTNTRTDFITTEALPGDTSVPDPVNVTFAVAEIVTGSLDNTTEVAIGEAKRVLITAVIPEDSDYDLEFAFIIPSEDSGKIEFCDGAIVSVGDNLPCIDPLTDAEIASSSGGAYNDIAKFNLGRTCNRPLRKGDQKANTVVFEAYFVVLQNGLAAENDTVTVAISLRTFLTTVTVDSIDFTVTNPDAFVDRALTLDGLTNETVIYLDKASPLVLGIGENSTVTANITVPKQSVSKFLFDVDLPTSDSACLTVNDIRVIGSVGRNVLCVQPDVNTKGIVRSPEYNSSFGTSQRNYVFAYIGIVTNTGLTHRRNTFVTGDDDIQIEFDIQMADCDANYNGTIHKLSVGHKSSDIYIYDHNVQVFRDGSEKPDIDFTLEVGGASTSSKIYVEGTVFHTATSTAEGKNTSIFISLPVYQVAPSVLLSASNQTCNVVPYVEYPSLLQIFCEDFFFTDFFTFTAEITLNDSVVLPVGFSGMDSQAQGWVGTNYVMRYNTYENETYPISGQKELQYSVDGGIDKSGLSALGLEDSSIVADCQITSSSGNLAPATNARLNNVGAWEPFVRNAKFAANRYLVVYFGNLHKFSKMAVQQDEVHVDLVTELTVEYTDDMMSWFGEEIVSLGPSPSDLENVTLSGRTARGVRVSLTNDTAYGVKADVGVKFEFYGNKLTSDVTQSDACSTLADCQQSVPGGYPAFGPRSFVVDVLSSTVYVCDRRVDRKSYRGECKTSSDAGVSWEKLDGRLECMIGYETSNSRLYAYAHTAHNRTIMMREASDPWRNVPITVLEEDKVKLTWTDAIIVPEKASAELDRITPHSSYKTQTWGATFDGMFENNVINARWTAP